MLQSYLISRRRMLRGLGVGLALPWLEIMSPAIARAGKAKTPPVRLGVLFKGNGVHPPSWDIPGDSETNFQLSALLEPLQAVRDKVLILSNLNLPEGGGSHHSSAVAFLSGADSPGSVDVAQPVTMDQLAATRIGNRTPMRSLELSADGLFLPQPRCSYISYGVDGKSVPRENDPQMIFDRMFRGFGSTERRARTKSILDAVTQDTGTLRRAASDADRRTLDNYFEAIRDLERTLEQAGSPDREERWQPGPAPELHRPPVFKGFPERVRAMLDLMVLAFWTDTTRIVTFMLGNENSRLIFDFLGINEEHHYLSHFVRHPEVEYIRKYNEISLWHVKQFAYVIDRMAKIPDGEGSLLDHSILMYGSAIKHGDYHTNLDLPIVLAGGGGGSLKTGRRVRYSEPQPYSNLLLSLLQRVGVPETKFGSSTGPLPGLDKSLAPVPSIKDDGSWVVKYDSPQQLTVRGLLSQSEKIDEINLYYIQLSSGERIKVRASFGNMNNTRFDEFCGRVVTVVGKYAKADGATVIQEITGVKR